MEIATNILLAVVAGLLAWDKWVAGRSQIRQQIIDDYKARNVQLEERVKELTARVDALSNSLTEMKMSLQEKDKHINNLTTILQGKNPELLEVLSGIRSHLEAQSENCKK